MTYAETAALTQSQEFQARIIAACTEQALIFVDDARPEFVEPANAVILSPANGLPYVNLVAGQPGITAASTDGAILAALQAVWPKYGAALIDQEAP